MPDALEISHGTDPTDPDSDADDVRDGAGSGAIDIADELLILRGVGGHDVDGDGLTSTVELLNGASPFLADSDGDGLDDFAELNPPAGTPATNPGSRDSDGDGLLDVEEIVAGGDGVVTDPNLADTDGDGIADGRDGTPLDGLVFYHGDHLGSTTTLTNHEGTELSRVLYKPFGEAVGGTAPTFGFTGQRYEASLGLYDYGARFYDPALGRFLSPDRVVQEPFNPQSHNRYSYVMNDPLGRVDPSGNISLDFSGGFSFAAYGGSSGVFFDEFFGIPRFGTQISGFERNVEGPPVAFESFVEGLPPTEPVGAQASSQRLSGPPQPELSSQSRDSGVEPSWAETTSTIAGGVSTYGSVGEYSNVVNGQWRGANGWWYSLDWGGNQWTGGRTSVVNNATSFRALAKGFFYVGAGVSLVEGGAAALEGDVGGVTKAGADVGFGYLGVAGGPWGAAASAAYWAVDLTVGWQWMLRAQPTPGPLPLWDGLSP